MKSTMKSAFAFIAVALMIMVAVVPMVGVFTEDSSAETVIVPPGTTTQITVKGTVSDSTSQKIQNALVEVKYGNDYYAYGITNSSGAYEIKVNYETDANEGYVNLKVTVISGENDDQKYEALTGLTTNPAKGKFTDLNNYQLIERVKGDISGIDFMSGKITLSGKLLYANTTDIDYDSTATISVETVAENGPQFSSTVNSNDDGSYSILVDMMVGEVKISCDGFGDVTRKIVASNISKVNLKNEDTYKAFVSYADENNNLTAESIGIVPVKAFAKETDADGNYTGRYTLTYKLSEGDKKGITLSDEKGYGYKQFIDLSATPSTVAAYKENAYIEGTIKMKDLPIIEATEDKLSFEYFKGNAGNQTAPSDVDVEVTNGVYRISFGKATGLDEINGVKITYELEEGINGSTSTITLPTDKSNTGITGKHIVLSETGYFLINGTVKNNNVAVKDVVINVTTRGKTVGVKENKVTTGADGKYAFYVKSGNGITVTPDGINEASFSPSSYELVPISNKTLDFTMDSKQIPSEMKVADALNNPLTGVTVKYRVRETGTYSDAIFDDESNTFTVTVRSDVTADDVFVYFEKTGYTFDATSTNPVKMSEGPFMANETIFEFGIRDLYNEDIKDPSGISLQFAKYTVRQVGVNTYEFDSIGTKSDVTYDAATKKFSFIAAAIGEQTLHENFSEVYGISVKSNNTEYTFDEVMELNEYIKANEGTYKGVVMDASGSTGLKGITVAVYDDNGQKISKDVTTFNDGSFTITSKPGKLKAVDPNGIYTFSHEPQTMHGGDSAIINANERTYSGIVKDADGEPVINASITVKVVDKDGKTVGSIATVNKDGTFKIITGAAQGNKIVTTDADGKRTFDIIPFVGSPQSLLIDVISNQGTLKGVVKEKGENGKGIEGITVTISIYNDKVDPKVIGTPKTDKSGNFSLLVNKLTSDDNIRSHYGVVATSTDIYTFTEEVEMYDQYEPKTIIAMYEVGSGSVKSADEKELSGIKVTVYNGETVVGEYTTNGKGVFKYTLASESMKFKAVDPNGVYTFDVSNNKDIVAKEKTFKVNVSALYGAPHPIQDMPEYIPLAGITVNFMKGDKVVKTAVTDADGMATAILAACDSCKAVDGNTKYGPMTFSTPTNANGGWKIIADQSIYSGYYAHGDNVPNVAVTFDMSLGGKFIDKGKAVVIDNEYFIVSAAKEANEINVMANAQGFFAKGKFDALEKIGTLDLEITEKPGIVNVNTEDVFFGKYYAIYNATNAQVGDKIILRAQGVAYKPLESGNETTVLKYTFDGWYVNGVKVSDDLEYVYTVTENCLVYADYKASTYETEPAPDNSISPSVLAIGIAAVIVALIAVVYTVIQKKE